MNPRVMKFGGSSVADASCMRQVAKLVREALPAAPLVVLSAMGKTTNALFRAAAAAEKGDRREALREARALLAQHKRAAEELFPDGLPQSVVELLEDREDELYVLLRGVAMLKELSPRSSDAVTSVGERLSSPLLAAYLEASGVPTTWVDSRQVVRTDANFGRGRPAADDIRKLAKEWVEPHLGPGRAVVMPGYIGATADGLTTTLGRGGSDYSAALLGAAIDADEVQIWTDVEGVLTCDPTLVPEAEPVPALTFAEAAELAAFGAKVLHPATIQPAVEAGILVTVRHTHHPDGRFTSISREIDSPRPLAALATRRNVTVLTLNSARMLEESGFLARLFEVFGRQRVSVDLVATAEVSVSLTLDAEDPLETLVEELGTFCRVEVARERAILAVIGEGLKETPGLAGRLFSALENINIEMISMGGNEINLSFVVRDELAPDALRRLHPILLETCT